VHDLSHVNQLRELAIQVLGDEELEFFNRKFREFYCQSIEDGGIIPPFIGNRIDDGKRLCDRSLGFRATEFMRQCFLCIDFFNGIREIDGRIYEEILRNADFALVGVDDA